MTILLLYLVDYADLAVIDLSKANTLAGRMALGAQLRDAMREHGFFYVINHGLTPAQVRIPLARAYSLNLSISE